MKDYYREGLIFLAEEIVARAPYLLSLSVQVRKLPTTKLEEEIEKTLRTIAPNPITELYFKVVHYSGRIEESLLMELFSGEYSNTKLLREGTDQIMKFHNFIKDICLNN